MEKWHKNNKEFKNSETMNIGTMLALAGKALNGVKQLVSNPNFVQNNNAFVRQEQAKNVAYRYGTIR